MTTGSPTDEVVDGDRLTEQFRAMTPLQKWETLVLSGLIGTDEPWIADMRASLQSLEARIEEKDAALKEALDLIRELRLADGHANRTGDEVRFDRAFSALLRFEFTASAALTPSNRDRT